MGVFSSCGNQRKGLKEGGRGWGIMGLIQGVWPPLVGPHPPAGRLAAGPTNKPTSPGRGPWWKGMAMGPQGSSLLAVGKTI